MKFIELMKKKTADNQGVRTPIVAFLGDSVTQGVFETYQKNNELQVVFDSASAYPEKFKELLAMLYPQAPISIINAGVSGNSVAGGYERLKRDVLSLSPDLLIVCFGLNDVNAGMEGIENYKTTLRNIFQIAKDNEIETIFMTPNMMNTDSSKVCSGEILESLAESFAKLQLEGTFDAYMDTARSVCSEEKIILCDCYAVWKKMYNSGADTTKLLANGLNHPIKKMHELFAWQLVQTIINN